MNKKMTGHTATYSDSAFSGLIIKYNEADDSQIWVQRFYPKNEETFYSKPVLKDLEFRTNEDTAQEEPSFKFWHTVYFTSEFMRDNYMDQINAVLGGEKVLV